MAEDLKGRMGFQAGGECQAVSVHTICHRDPDILAELRDEWMKVLADSACPPIFMTWQWQKAWWDAFGGSYELFLLAHRSEEGRLAGVAPLYRERLDSGPRILRLIGGVDVCDYLDILQVAGSEDAVCEATFRYLVAHGAEWDVLDLHCLPEASPTRTALSALFREDGYEVREIVEEECPILSLPGTWEEYLESLSAKNRHELRRKMRRAGEVVDEGVDRVTSKRDLREALEVFFSLHRQANPKKEAFLTPQVQEFFEAFACSFLEAGWLDLSFLVAGGRRVASFLCFDWNDRVYVYNSGYDRRFARFSVGIALLGRIIEAAIARGMKQVDFLRGREHYKFRLGGRAVPVYRLIVHKGAVPADFQ